MILSKFEEQFEGIIQTAGEHFWVHHTSELIHPVGWSYLTGHEIEATEEYNNEVIKMIETKSYPANIAPADVFREVNNNRMDFK